MTYLDDWDVQLHLGNALDVLPELETGSLEAVVTSPPYLDARPEYPSPTEDEFGAIFRELRRVCTGPMLLNVGRLWRERQEQLWWMELIRRALRVGWPHRDTIVWIKQNANPFQGEVVTNAHEYILCFGDGYDEDAVRTEYDDVSLARMKRKFINHAGVKGDVSVKDPTELEVREPNEKGARGKSYFICPVGKEKGNKHPAPMPLELAEYMVRLSGGHRILDPFAGSGTTLLAARRLGRTALGIELSPEYAEMCAERLSQQALPINEEGESE
jgi:site-specific DNA-methyltransferase (adenine-specific)